MLRRIYLALVIRPRPPIGVAERARAAAIQADADRLIERNRREIASRR